MKKELISDFTRRISQCNKGGLIVIMYDIVFAYLDEAKQSYEKKDHEAFKEAVRNADRSILELIHSLDFSYEIAKELYPLYVYCREELSKTLYKNRLDELNHAEKILRSLSDSFVKAAEQDTSGPLMSNTQQVYAGYTYGRDNLTENCQEFDTSRGFLA
ncbi:MAG: flagellar protein FliS [Roseburia sp.]|uniref:flagellar export chaperone FliS n=1 Tax=Roseburia sp. 831b TaxID=1261635 RepID=UPI0009535CB2|nr:flagellar protein FliS [Roseburia sp. 831b]MCI5919307.1 flagellar protein FliS [Roseburia sp.]MDD6216043.1 flagellar protein FliS [Roseburia sp.]MDY5882372.1 flagellar protein FliS [Roseburia sp.]WVK72517.1 flagellar protein FliS [Roseburia sp. 831b]